MLEEMMRTLGEMIDPNECINCHKPIEENDQGFPAELPNARICTPCMEAKFGLMYDLHQGIDITYRDGTTERIGG
jgi:hypothetical protein